jgi:hypothetical protein
MTQSRGILRVVLSVAAVAIAGVVLVAATGAFAAKTKAPKDCIKPRVEPSRIVIGCADFSSYVDHLKWGKWHKKRARGHGRFNLNNCKPDCASGTTHHYRAKVRLTDPKREQCNGHNVKLFTRMHLRFPHKQPPHAKRFRTNRLFCNP